MPAYPLSYPASGPVSTVVELPAGTLIVRASERDDVVVNVEPGNPAKARDLKEVAEISVHYADGALTVTSNRRGMRMLTGPVGVVVVTIDVPTGSSLNGKVSAGSTTTEGVLGDVDLRASAGEVRLEETGRLDASASAGAITVGRVVGPISVKASMGSVRVRELLGDGVIKSSMGEVQVGAVTGNLTVSSSMGEIAVGTLRGTVTTTTSAGSVRVDRVVTGAVNLSASSGTIEVGIAHGTAAWLDVSATHGAVRNLLEPTSGPGESDATAEIHATTNFGDIVIRRAA